MDSIVVGDPVSDGLQSGGSEELQERELLGGVPLRAGRLQDVPLYGQWEQSLLPDSRGVGELPDRQATARHYHPRAAVTPILLDEDLIHDLFVDGLAPHNLLSHNGEYFTEDD